MNAAASSLTDEQIINHIQEGESSEYFPVLYDRYYQKVLDKCFSLVRNKTVAEELAEDIFSKVYEKIGTFKKRSSFSSWLYVITYNYCIDYLRERKRLHYPSWSRENEIPEIVDESDEPINNITYENLLQVLELVHPEEKALLMMKYHDNLSLRQIGESLRISEDAAKMRLKRARSRVIYIYKNKFGWGES